MKNKNKTKQQLMDELVELRRYLADLEEVKSKWQQNANELHLFKAIVESSNEAIAVSDPSGRLIYINPAHEQLFGRMLEEAKKLTYRDFYPPESVEVHDKQISPALASGESWEGALEALDAKGRCFPLWERANAVHDAEGIILYGFGVMHEITEHKLALEAIRESENKYRTLLEHLPQKIFLKDKDSVYLSCNKNYADDLKIKPEEIVGKSDYEFYPKELAEKYRADDERIMQMGKTQDIEERYIQNEKEIIVHTVKTPIKDEKGNVCGVIGIFWDISKRKQAEKELQKRTHDLRERVKELNCLYGISALRERLGISLEEIFQGTADLIPPSWQYPDITCARIVFEDRDFKTQNFKETRWKQNSDILVSGECIGSLEVYYLEKKPQSDEGPFLEEERRLINAIAERLGTIIEHKRVMDMLETERDKFQGVLNALGKGVYIVNPDFVIEYQNEILEVPFPGNKGRKCYNTYMMLDEPCGYCLLKEAVDSGQVKQTEAIRSDGKSYDIIFSPFIDVDGDMKGIVLLRDITEKKILEAEAMRAGHLAALGELAAGVAHEINNPINGIINYAEILKGHFYAQDKDTEIPKRIIKAGERIAQIVNNLLSFARHRDEKHSAVHVRDILADTLGLVENQIMKDGIILSSDIPPGLPKVKARSQEIQQVFLNILSNARYALNQRFPIAHNDKVIQIKGETVIIRSHKHVRVTFHDSGTGIPEEILDCICNPFFSTKPKGEGTGLGLSISHGIMNNHRGRLYFKSLEGEYTKVIVELPTDEI
jgi:PAS domain S-box-containing protein